MSIEWFKEFFKYGIVGAVAGILFYLFVMDVRADQRANRTEHAASTAAEVAAKALLSELVETQRRSVYLQLQQCLHGARTAGERSACARYMEIR